MLGKYSRKSTFIFFYFFRVKARRNQNPFNIKAYYTAHPKAT